MEDVLDLGLFAVNRHALIALAQVLLIDITLAGDNAVVIGMTAVRVRPEERRKVIFWGLTAAVVMRIAFAYFAVLLLNVIGATFAGGILLLWVTWRLWRDLRESRDEGKDGADAAAAPKVGLARAVILIMVADLSMSLDNVLAVAGVAQPLMATDPWVLFVGLFLSVALMGVAAVFIAKILKRYPWIAYAGVAMIAYVAVRMILHGGDEVLRALHVL